MEHRKVYTSAEVYAVIMARHPEMTVFGSYSAPDGDHFGDPSRAKMFTEWGFYDSDIPTVGVETTWDAGNGSKREHLKSEYWLCFPVSDIE